MYNRTYDSSKYPRPTIDDAKRLEARIAPHVLVAVRARLAWNDARDCGASTATIAARKRELTAAMDDISFEEFADYQWAWQFARKGWIDPNIR